MRIRTFLLSLLVINILSSCGYKMITVTTVDGKKFKERQYSDFDKGEQYIDEIVYKRIYKAQEYLKFSGKITSDTISTTLKDADFIQFDSNERIYLEFGDKQYISLFKAGLIYPKMIFCATDSCKPLYDYNDTIISDTSDATIAKYGRPKYMEYQIKGDDTINLFHSNGYSKPPENALDIKYLYIFPSKYDRYRWKGVSVTIRYIKELKYLEKSKHKRVFKFEIAMYEHCCNPTDYRYYIELENNDVGRKTKLNDFVKNAKVTFFYFSGKAYEI